MVKERFILAGDIGASKTILALYSSDIAVSTPVKEEVFESPGFSGLVPMLESFLVDVDAWISSAAFGAAGPVIDQKAKITKLPWTIETSELQDYLSIQDVFVINDLVANVYGLSTLESDDLVPLYQPVKGPLGPKVMISPGTGLGEAFFVDTGNGLEVYASEGGHSHFSPSTPELLQMMAYFQESMETVTVDTFCCGDGIVNIYGYLKQCGSFSEDESIARAMADSAHPAAVITKNSVLTNHDERCSLCIRTVEMFVEVLAAEAANMVLKMLACGGVFIGGGIPPRILPYLERIFMKHFSRHQTMSHILSTVPVHVVNNPKTALYGALSYARQKQI